MDRSEERLIRLEERFVAERDRVNYYLAHLSARQDRLEPRPQITGPSLKLLLAIGLGLMVWLITGDPRAGLRAGLTGGL